MGTLVFESEREKMKHVVMKEAQNFCDMLDCVEGPPALECTIDTYGVKVKISAALVEVK
jgi:hypothetical protein